MGFDTVCKFVSQLWTVVRESSLCMVTDQHDSVCFSNLDFSKKTTPKHVIPSCDIPPHSSLALFVRPIRPDVLDI